MTATLYRIDGTQRTYTQLFGTTLPQLYDDYGTTAPVPPSNQTPAVVLIPVLRTVNLRQQAAVQLTQPTTLRLPRT